MSVWAVSPQRICRSIHRTRFTRLSVIFITQPFSPTLRSCLELADLHGIKSIAFCCISTGEFHFPNDVAAEIAITTVKDYVQQKHSEMEVIFNVFKDVDYEIYRKILGSN